MRAMPGTTWGLKEVQHREVGDTSKKGRMRSAGRVSKGKKGSRECGAVKEGGGEQPEFNLREEGRKIVYEWDDHFRSENPSQSPENG